MDQRHLSNIGYFHLETSFENVQRQDFLSLDGPEDTISIFFLLKKIVGFDDAQKFFGQKIFIL